MFNFNDYEMDYILFLEYGIRLVEYYIRKYFIFGQFINKVDYLSLNLIILVIVLILL